MTTFLAAFAPDPDALLRALSREMREDMLRDIATADYGFRIEEHLAGLRAFCALAPPAALAWEPREVLELTRWSEPDDPDYRGGGKGARGHWMRAFSCAALLRAAGGPDGGAHRDGLNETLIQLLDSLDRLDAGLEGAAASLLAWCIPALEPGESAERAFLGVGLLWCALRADVGDDATIGDLCTWLTAQEQEAMASRHVEGVPRWLLDTTFHGQRHHAWQILGERLATLDLPRRAPQTLEWARLIGTSLSGA